jgi:hypothetical protein
VGKFTTGVVGREEKRGENLHAKKQEEKEPAKVIEKEKM